jgi:1-deoxy-D-xylulose-5-phosphate synthase
VQPFELGRSEVISRGRDICIIAVGNMVPTAVTLASRLSEYNLEPTLVNARFIKPLDCEMVREMASSHRLLVTMEENVLRGGYGMAVCQLLEDEGLKITCLNIALPDDYIEHGNVDILRHEAGIDAETVFEEIMQAWYQVCHGGKD